MRFIHYIRPYIPRVKMRHLQKKSWQKTAEDKSAQLISKQCFLHLVCKQALCHTKPNSCVTSLLFTLYGHILWAWRCVGPYCQCICFAPGNIHGFKRKSSISVTVHLPEAHSIMPNMKLNLSVTRGITIWNHIRIWSVNILLWNATLLQRE